MLLSRALVGKTLVGLSIENSSFYLRSSFFVLCHSNELSSYYSAKYSTSILNSLFLSYSGFFAYLLRLAPADSSSAASIVDLLSLLSFFFLNRH